MAKNKKEIETHADKLKKREMRIKVLKIGLLTTTLFLIIIYFLLKLFYNNGDFTIILDQNFARDKGIIMYENSKDKVNRMILEAARPDTMDNISINWLPKNINDEADGSHNGQNYIAYTFYIENLGLDTNYWYSIVIDDVIKNVDDAARVEIFLNGKSTVYAKMGVNGQPEPGTTPFYSDKYVCMQERAGMKTGDIDKFTVVIWVEGDDPQCLDNIIGGEMKMHMEIQEEKILQ
ncbi:MAG: hypothetical protein FWF46_01705 [Oscillospiraceae bacterium]|nr:hypothetical protein [Oscillospiraceae bacterium]